MRVSGSSVLRISWCVLPLPPMLSGCAMPTGDDAFKLYCTVNVPSKALAYTDSCRQASTTWARQLRPAGADRRPLIVAGLDQHLLPEADDRLELADALPFAGGVGRLDRLAVLDVGPLVLAQCALEAAQVALAVDRPQPLLVRRT